MGRPRTRPYLNDALRLRTGDLRQLSPGRFIPWGWSSGATVGATLEACALVLTYTATRDGVKQNHRVQVPLERVPRHLGGEQTYFRCPCCTGRAMILYLLGTVFACRRCARLPYLTQQVDPVGRAEIRYYRLRRKLSKEPERFFGDIPARPKGMHASTYAAIRGACWKAYTDREELLAPGLERILAKIERLEGKKGGGFWR